MMLAIDFFPQDHTPSNLLNQEVLERAMGLCSTPDTTNVGLWQLF